MRMEHRVIVVFLAQLAAIGVLSTGVLTPVLPFLSFAWCCVFLLLIFRWLRCPHCGALAWARGLLLTPFVGTQCSKCGEEY